ncbi:MAG TPA: hypothetical protein VGW77_37055 [Candidatus Binatia bacterium]|jgi:NAD(P)-dependent dehydrogenase (short-subunit alcohol dehydrogenase family)|nr:hypothetical protein [Candidatus Binatia bacterium]
MEVAVIAGVGPGTGAALGRAFARAGYAVGLLLGRAETRNPVAEEIAASGGQIGTPRLREREPNRPAETVIPPERYRGCGHRMPATTTNCLVTRDRHSPAAESF